MPPAARLVSAPTRNVWGLAVTRLKTLLVAAVAAACLAGPLPGPGGAAPAAPTAPAAPQALSRSCTAGGVTWRVDYTYWGDTDYGPLVKVDGLKQVQAGGVTDAAALTWEWRLDNLAAQWPPATLAWAVTPFRFTRGPRQTGTSSQWFGVEWQSFRYSPRVVTPDGGCQVYLSPFPNTQAQPSWPAVAVLGDSLLQSLNDSTFNQTYDQGFVEAHLNAQQVRAEVEGQGGRRWTPSGAPGLARADSYLLDEFRGLATHGPAGFVVALGANDALGLALVADPTQRDAARQVVHDDLIATVAEMAADDCVVAVTTVEHPLGAYVDPQTYATEASAINDVLRFLAAIDPDDGFAVYDFAAPAALHQYGSADPWFGADNLHLNDVGRLVYTDAMWQAADQCV